MLLKTLWWYNKWLFIKIKNMLRRINKSSIMVRNSALTTKAWENKIGEKEEGEGC